MNSEAILAALRKEPASAKDLAVTLELSTSRPSVAELRAVLERLEREGRVQRTKAGTYEPWIWEAV